MNEYQQALVRIIELEDRNAELLEACTIAFDLLTDLTTDEFSRGLDRPARLALGKAIRKHKGE